MKTLEKKLLVLFILGFILTILSCENEKEYFFWTAAVTEDGLVLYNQSPKFLTPCDKEDLGYKATGWWRMDCLDGQGEYYQAFGTIYSEYLCDEDGNRYQATRASGMEPIEKGDCFKVPPSVIKKLKPLVDQLIIDMKVGDTTGIVR